MFVPFAKECDNALINSITSNKHIDFYIRESFKGGMFKKDLKDLLNRYNITIDKKVFTGLYKQGHKDYKRHHVGKYRRQIRRLIFHDQFARIFRKQNIQEVDSINYYKLKQILQQDRGAFNREKIGMVYADFLEILILHQGWHFWKNDFNNLRQLIISGYIHRDVLYQIIERESVWGGKQFTLLKDSLIELKTKENETTLCNGYYYSCLGGRAFYSAKLHKQIVVPVFPMNTEIDLNQLRSFVFQPSYEQLKIQSPYLEFLNKDEFCNIFK